MDYETNKDVAAALKRTEEIIQSKNIKTTWIKWSQEVKENPEAKLKGIDDYLAYKVKKIIPV